MQYKAVSKFVRVSPRKASIVVDQIRGKTVEQAREILAFTHRGIAEYIEKTLNSAVANAGNCNNVNFAELKVSRAFVDEGPIMKRYRPRAKGAASRIRKRTSHITVIVSTGEEG